MRHNPEYFQWCLQRLTPHQYAVYCACQYIGEAETTSEAIAQMVGFSVRIVRHHMRAVHRLGFIRYDVSNKTGTVILWVRQSAEERAPAMGAIARKKLSVNLQNSTGKIYTVRRGQIRRFCIEQGLNRNGIYELIDSKRDEYKGWRCV